MQDALNGGLTDFEETVGISKYLWESEWMQKQTVEFAVKKRSYLGDRQKRDTTAENQFQRERRQTA